MRLRLSYDNDIHEHSERAPPGNGVPDNSIDPARVPDHIDASVGSQPRERFLFAARSADAMKKAGRVFEHSPAREFIVVCEDNGCHPTQKVRGRSFYVKWSC